MANGTDIAAVSSQHPDVGQAVAEIIGTLSERQTLAPSLVVAAVSGRFAADAPNIGHAIHTLLQSDKTLVTAADGLVGGSQILDTTGAATAISFTDTDVALGIGAPIRTGAVWASATDPVAGGAIRLGLDVSPSDRDQAAIISITSAGTNRPIFLLEGDNQRQCQQIEITLHAVDPVLTESVGAAPIGLPSPITAARGARVMEIDGVGARSLIMNRLELHGPEPDGPSIDLPRMVAELVGDPDSDQQLAVVESSPADDSITLASALPVGSVIQLMRHDSVLAGSDAVARQWQGSDAMPQAVLLTANLAAGATTELVASAADTLSPDLMGVVGRPHPGPGLPWPSASILSLR